MFRHRIFGKHVFVRWWNESEACYALGRGYARSLTVRTLSIMGFIALLAAGSQQLAAQNFTNVTAAHVQSNIGGTLLARGKVCALPTDQNDQPVTVHDGAGGLVSPNTPACATVVTGVVDAAYQVANSATTNPAGIYYRIQVTDLCAACATRNTVIIDLRAVPNVSGATWSLDSYVPTGTITPPTGNAYWDLFEIPAPGNPPSGFQRFYANLSTHLITCLTSAGANCSPAGGGSGTVTSFSAGNLSPLFTTSVATPTSTPAVTFTLSNFAAHTFFGNNTGSTAAPAAVAIGAADLPATITSNTSGNSATATALAANGTNCSSGNYPLGVDASGNAESCTVIPVTSVFSRTGAVVATSGDYTAAQVTNAEDKTVANTLTNVAAPATPGAGFDSVYADSTDKRFHDKNDAGTIGTTVVAKTAASHKFFNILSAAGVLTDTQPDFTDLSGQGTCPQEPALAGDVTSSAGSCTTALANIPDLTTQAGSILATNIAAPTTPAAGKTKIYVDSTSKKLCSKDDAGGVNCTGGAGGFANPMTTLGDLIYGGASGTATRLAGPTGVNSVAQSLVSTPSGGAATAPAWAPSGVATNAQTGTSYTVAATDRASYVTFSNAGAIAVTLPDAGTSGFGSNFVFVACDIGAGTATISRTTSSTISYTTGSAYTSAATSLALTTGQCAWIYSDNTNYFAIVRNSNATTINGTAMPASASVLGTNGSSQPVAATGHGIATPLTCADSSASGTAQVCNTSPTFTPAAGDCITYTTTTANSGTGLTLNVNSLGAKSVAKWQGSTTLAANDVLANKEVHTCYDGTNWELATIGNAPAGGGSGAPGGVTILKKVASYTGVSGDFSSSTLAPTQTIFTLTGTAQAYTLPSTAPSSGACVIVENSLASAPFILGIVTGGSTTLDGTAYTTAASSPALGPGQSAWYCSDGTNYFSQFGRSVPVITVANKGGFWADGMDGAGGFGANGPVSGTVNVPSVQQFVLKGTYTASKIAINVSTAVAATTCDVGIYDSSGNQLTHAAVTCTAVNQVSTNLATTVTFPSGVYYIAGCVTNNIIVFSGPNNGAAINTKTTLQTGVFGTAANTCTAGVLPATLGTISNAPSAGAPTGYLGQ